MRGAGTFLFKLRVTDSEGEYDEADVVVTVNEATNAVPTADAGPDQTTLSNEGVILRLDGRASSDPDSDALTYVWSESGVDIAYGRYPYAYFEPGIHIVTLTVTDTYGASDTSEVIVTVSEFNRTPVSNAGPNQSVTASHGGDPSTDTGAFTLDGTASSDPDGDTLTYEWTEGGTVVGMSATLALTRVPGTHTFTLKVTDPDGEYSEDDVVVTVAAAPNVAPVSDAGPDQTVTASHGGDPSTDTGAFTLDGTASSDPDSDTLTYEWRAGSTVVGTTATLALSRTPGTHTFTLKVTDPYGDYSENDVTVTVNAAPNAVPVSNAGPDQTVAATHGGDPSTDTGAFTLDGTASSDPDSDTLTYEWRAGSTVVGTTATLALMREPGTYTFTLKVTDPYGDFSEDDVVVTVAAAPNVAPVSNAGPDQTVTATHGGDPLTDTGAFTLDGTGSSDPDSDTLTYEWTEGGTVVGTTATLALSRGPGTHTFTLKVTDTYGDFSEDDVTVTVTAAPNAAPVSNAGPDQTVTATHGGDPTTDQGTFTLDGTGSSDPDSDTLTYEWKEGSTVVGTTATLALARDPGTYTFTLKVTDTYGEYSEDDVVVTVNAAPNAAPVSNAGLDQTVAATHGGDPLTDTGAFTLDGTASSDPDSDTLTYEWRAGSTVVGTTATLALTRDPGTYTFTLKVTDPYGEYSEDEIVVTVNISNVAPVSDAGPNQTVTATHGGDPSTDTGAFTLDGTASSDPDGDTLTYEWKEGSTVVGTTATLTLARVVGNHVFTLKVTDSYGEYHENDVVVTVNEAPNASPVADAGPDQTVSSNEGVFLRLDGRASSDSDGDTLTYAWSESGVDIAYGNHPYAYFEPGIHIITLTVTDTYGASDTSEVIVTVSIPSNDPPVSNAGPDQTVTASHGGNPLTDTGSFTLDGTGSSDPEGDTLTYEWTESGSVVGTTATLTLMRVPGTYTFTLRVTDPDGEYSEDDVVVTVNAASNASPVSDAGPDQSVTASHAGNPLTDQGTFTLDGTGSSDPDGDTLTYEWTEGSTVVGTTATLALTRVLGTHTFTLKVTDTYGEYHENDVVVTVNAASNRAPTASAGPDQTISSKVRVLVTLNGSSSSDPDGDGLTYVWSVGSVNIAYGRTPTAYFLPGTHNVKLTVTDTYGGTSEDYVQIFVDSRTVTTVKMQASITTRRGVALRMPVRVASNVTLIGKTLSYYVDNVLIGTVTSANPAYVTYTPSSSMSLGAHALKVRFEGDTTHQPSEATATLTVKR